MEKCNICPRQCNVAREDGQLGFCRTGAEFSVARSALHFWEEPCISGSRGSGTVFFTGCNLGCVFCQNEAISRGGVGKKITDEELMGLFDDLISQGAHNINLVTPTHYIPRLAKVLRAYQSKVPVVYNCGGYESVESLRLLEGLVDIYLPDFKYFSDETARRYANAPGYYAIAMDAIHEMERQVGALELDDNGMARRGVLVRHLVLPGCATQSVKLLRSLDAAFPDGIGLSLMGQYLPCGKAKTMPPLDRTLTRREYQLVRQAAKDLSFAPLYCQSLSSAQETYIPDWDLCEKTEL